MIRDPCMVKVKMPSLAVLQWFTERI